MLLVLPRGQTEKRPQINQWPPHRPIRWTQRHQSDTLVSAYQESARTPGPAAASPFCPHNTAAPQTYYNDPAAALLFHSHDLALQALL